jgi:hypothetical protein
MPVIIGLDPHERSATIEVINERVRTSVHQTDVGGGRL